MDGVALNAPIPVRVGDISDLGRIADTLEAIASTPNHWWVSPVAILTSAALAFVVSQFQFFRSRRDTRTANDAKRQLVHDLLWDEIYLKWVGALKPQLKRVLDSMPDDDKPIEYHFAKRFSRLRVSADDIYAFYAVSKSFQDYYFLNDTKLLTKVVHAYVLYADLLDLHERASELVFEYRDLSGGFYEALGSVGSKRKAMEIVSDRLREVRDGATQCFQELEKEFEVEIGPRLESIRDSEHRPAALSHRHQPTSVFISANDPLSLARWYSQHLTTVPLSAVSETGGQAGFHAGSLYLGFEPAQTTEATPRTTLWFDVDDLESKVRELEQAGATRTAPPTPSSDPSEVLALLTDPAGNPLGLIGKSKPSAVSAK